MHIPTTDRTLTAIEPHDEPDKLKQLRVVPNTHFKNSVIIRRYIISLVTLLLVLYASLDEIKVADKSNSRVPEPPNQVEGEQ